MACHLLQPLPFYGRVDGFCGGRTFCSGSECLLTCKNPLRCFLCQWWSQNAGGTLLLDANGKNQCCADQIIRSILTDPTMGGVSASFAMLGDVIIAEPKALIGFAGPRVIEQTVGEKLPEGFQRSEFLIEKGAIDRIIPRHKLRREIADMLCILTHKPRPQNMAEVDAIPKIQAVQKAEEKDVAITDDGKDNKPA